MPNAEKSFLTFGLPHFGQTGFRFSDMDRKNSSNFFLHLSHENS